MKTLSEADLKALNEAPRALFLVEIEAPGFPEPIRVAQVDIVSADKRYQALPITFDTDPHDPVITVRGVAPFRSLLDAIDGAPATVRLVFDMTPDEPVKELRAAFHKRRHGDDGDIIGYLVTRP